MDGFLEDFDRLNLLLKDAADYETNIFRFPGGSKNSVSKKYGEENIMQQIIEVLEQKSVKYFDWNVTSSDADKSGKLVPKDKIVDNILVGSKNKKSAIILMHDTDVKTTTVEALPEVIEGLSKQGFRFGVLTKETQY